MERVKVGRFDDESVAIPMTDRVAVNRANGTRNVIAADAHDSSVVVHFRTNDQVCGRLYEFVVVVVEIGHHGRTRAPAIDDAALAEWPCLGSVKASSAPRRRTFVVIFDAHTTHARILEGNLSIRRIDDKRSAIFAAHLIEGHSGIDPK